MLHYRSLLLPSLLVWSGLLKASSSLTTTSDESDASASSSNNDRHLLLIDWMPFKTFDFDVSTESSKADSGFKGSKTSKAPKSKKVGSKTKKTEPSKSKKLPKTKCPKAPKGSKATIKGIKSPKGSLSGGCRTFAPTAVPTTATPTLVPTLAPTLYAGWRLGLAGEGSCNNVCAGAEPYNNDQTNLVDSEARIGYVYEIELGLINEVNYLSDSDACTPFYTDEGYYRSSGVTVESCSSFPTLKRICCCGSDADCPLEAEQ